MDDLTDIFFAICAVVGVGGMLFYWGQAHWWRVPSWLEDRRIDRAIRRRERGL